MSPNWRRISLGLWLALTPVLGLLYLTVPVSPDHALFDYIAWSHLQGNHYYSGVAEQNWPGQMLIHEMGLRLFGVHFWTFRLTDFLLLQAVGLASALLLRRSGFAVAPWFFLVLYPALYVSVGMWVAGQRDIVAAGFLIMAAALAMTGRRDPDEPASRRRLAMAECLGAGAFAAAAFLIRPTFLSYIFGLIVLEWLRFPAEPGRRGAPLTRSLLLLAGFCIPIGVLVLAGHRLGNLDDFYQQTILFNLQAYPVEGGRLRLLVPAGQMIAGWWHWIAALAAAGLMLWIWRAGLMRAQALILGLIATVLVSYFAQNKGFGYHLAGLLPAFCLLVAVLIETVATWRNETPGRWGRLGLGAILTGVLLIAMAGTVKKLAAFLPSARSLAEGELKPAYDSDDRQSWPEVVEIVRLIREGSDPSDHIVQWGRAFEVGYLAERQSSLRFVSTPALDLLSADFAGSDAWLTEVRDDLAAKPPRFILISRTALATDSAPFAPRPDASEAERIVVDLLQDYELVLSIPTALLFRQR